MTDPRTMDQRYQNDPVFRTVVDMLRHQLRQGQFTPSELREAVMLAATMHEMQNIRPLFYNTATGELERLR